MNRVRLHYIWQLYYGRVDVVKFLIKDKHCDSSTKDRNDRDNLYYAVRYGHLCVLKLLLQVCPSPPSIKTLLEVASRPDPKQ